MSLYSIAQPVVDRSYGKVDLVHSEDPFDKPKIAVVPDNIILC